MGDVFLTADWRDLVLLNYEVPADTLQARVPGGTELDLFHGKAWVSVVGFRFSNTRVRGMSIPWHSDFAEVNLRFCVRRCSEPARRGVVFVKEIVPRRAIAWLARTLYNENYHAHPMSHGITEAAGARTLSYELE